MNIVLMCYIIIINLIGFLLMGTDKSRARRGRYRISEKTLFMTAVIGGSIGVLTGMYVFRHKTLHLTFVFGIPAILIIQLLIIGFLLSMNRKHMESPAQAVEYELELIQNLDADTIQSFVSYENLTGSQITPSETGPETTRAIQLFFRNFRYKILNETITDDKADVSVEITNLDTRSLARDLREEILRQSVSIYPDSAIFPTTESYYRLLLDMLSINRYEQVTTAAYFHLVRDEAGWTILADSTLEDQLVSEFITNINDPFLLPPDTVLAAYLDAFGELTGSQWKDFLNISDVFATYNTDYSPRIDDEYMRQIASCFGYEILQCREEGTQARADVRITSLDLSHILGIYRKSLLGYAATIQSVKDDPVEASNEMSRLLLEALKANDRTVSTDISLTLTNDGTTWNADFDEEFTNALMGNLNEAIDSFAALNSDSKE